MPLTTLTTPLGKKRAAHLLRRTCHGGTVAEVDLFATLTPQEAVQRLFDSDLPDPDLPIDPLTGNEWITTGTAESEEDELTRYLLAWKVGQLLGSGIAEDKKLSYIFRERIVLFLHTLFTSKESVVRDSRALYYQQALFRKFAFDGQDVTIPSVDPEMPDTLAARNLRQLTKKISVDNAMLVFLDGRLNVKGSPNENYARELLELYSIGRGLEGNVPEPEFIGDYFYFTEEDVQAGARVLSGFNIDTTFSNIDEETGLPRGVIKGGITASSHEEGVKEFSSRLGGGTVVPDETLQLSGSSTEESILDEISQLVDIIYDRDETPIHVCRKIYRFFVYHEIDEGIQAGIIQDMANVFRSSGYRLQSVLTALFTSVEFYEAGGSVTDNSFGAIIKSPLDLELGFIRNFEIEVPSYVTDLDRFYEFHGGLLRSISQQGMDYYEPFEVAGYAAYHQFPIYNRSWITTNYLTNRYGFIQSSIVAGMDPEMGQVNVVDFVRNRFGSIAADARSLIIAVAEYFLPSADNLDFNSDTGELTSDRLNYFLTVFLFSPQIDSEPESAWTNRWNNNLDPETVANQLTNLFNAMLQTPEYQLM